jgi:glycine C-acetyltransferase
LQLLKIKIITLHIMVKDLFERIQNNKGPLGKWASQAEGYFVFPKLEVGDQECSLEKIF